MKKIYTFGGQPAYRNLTVADLRAEKGKKVFSQVTANTTEEAAAADEAGIDILTTNCPLTTTVRKGAPKTFLHTAIGLTDYRTNEAVIEAAYEAMAAGSDAVYTLHSLKMIEELANRNMPVMGHVGLVPRHSTWCGGLRALGKTSNEAIEIYTQVKRLEDAGAFAVEIECVPEQVLREISQRTNLITFSIGAGSGADVQFLFMEDICGENKSPPRHAKSYTDLSQLRSQIISERINALKAFHAEVHTGQFPTGEMIINMDSGELEQFRNALASKQ